MQITQQKTDALVPYARNAKRHDPEQISKIAASIREFGFNAPILVSPDLTIIAGHGRVMAAQKLGLKEVPCVILDHLTDTQRRAYVLADNRLGELGGGWDMEMLRLEVEDLGNALDGLGFDADELKELGAESESKSELSDDYTHKVDAPVYEPKGEKPPVSELCNSERAEQLIRDIDASTAPKEVKQFLKAAASRHIVFDYGKIAEFYCHADKPTQLLMEDSALVIIDFKKAMQLGYVKLKAEIADALESEQGGASEEDGDDE
jgi:ParB-like chromosome segregation protein Spo0J